jgi:hypothetical protein
MDKAVVVNLARGLHREHQSRLQSGGLTAGQIEDMNAFSRSAIIKFVQTTLKLDVAEAQRVVDQEVMITVH